MEREQHNIILIFALLPTKHIFSCNLSKLQHAFEFICKIREESFIPTIKRNKYTHNETFRYVLNNVIKLMQKEDLISYIPKYDEGITRSKLKSWLISNISKISEEELEIGQILSTRFENFYFSLDN